LVILIGLVAYYFAVISKISIVQLLLGAYGGVAQIFPIVFACFYWPRATKWGAIVGLLAGLIVNTLFLLFPEWKPLPMHEGIYGLIANVVCLVGISLLTLPDSHPEYSRFVTKKRMV
jgi:SSS family solute:Na+ symporter